MNKKLLTLLACSVPLMAFAEDDPFLLFNNNVGVVYQNNNMGSIATFNQYGISANVQTKNDFWLDAQVVSGLNTNTANNLTTGEVKFGYVFPFAKNQSMAYQLIPYVNFGYSQLGSPGMSGTGYVYGVGFRPEYRFEDQVKLSLDMGIQGTGNSFTGGNSYQYNTNKYLINYVITPEIDYYINRQVMLGVNYTFANNFENQTSMPYGSSANIVGAKIAWLFK